MLGAGGDPDGNETKDLSDHTFIAPYDEGACVLPPSLKSGIFLTHWGNDGSKHARVRVRDGGDDGGGDAGADD